MPGKKILAVVTNAAKYPGTAKPTGLWLGELVHFVDVVQKAGYEVDIASPKGGFVPIDPVSLDATYMTETDWAYYTDNAFMSKVNSSIPAAQVDASQYQAIYFAGGHGTMFDFNNDKNLENLIVKINSNGGTVSAVCHGVCALLSIPSPSGGKLIDGKDVTGFSNVEEDMTPAGPYIPYLLEDRLNSDGGKYSRGEPWASHVVVSGKLITGQNPGSTHELAEKLVANLK